MGIVSAGFDLSLTGSGIARSDTHRVSKVGMAGITNMSVVQQIAAFDTLTAHIFAAYDWHGMFVGTDPDDQVAVVEALDMAQSYGGQVERTILWWQVVNTLHNLGVKVYTPTSAQVKMYATGNGLAKKPEMIAAVRHLWPGYEIGKDDNLADAAAMAELGLALAGCPTLELPSMHLRSLSKIRTVEDPPSRVKKAVKR